MEVDKNNIEEYFNRYRDNVFAIGFNYFGNAQRQRGIVETDELNTETADHANNDMQIKRTQRRGELAAVQ